MLAMAHRAIGQMFNIEMMPQRQLASELRLIRPRLPIHVVSLRERALEFLRVLMALQAPLHEEGIGPEGERHLVDLSVAGRAANTFVNVNGVIEVNVVRQDVNAVPEDGLAGRSAVPHGLQQRAAGKKLGMAGHADLRGGHAREGRFLHRGVAIATVHLQLAHMVPMAKGDRLADRHPNLGDDG